MKSTLRITQLAIRLLLCFFACGITASAPGQTRTIRVVSYNIMADISGFTTPLAGLITPFSGTGTFTESSSGTVTNGGVLEGIGEEILAGNFQPIDILALQEPTNNAVTIQPIVDGLNAFYSSRGIPARYAMSPLQLTSTGGAGGGPNAMVYNTNTVQLVASVGVGTPSGSGISRQVGRYLFAPAGVATNASNIFYVYVSHYKSSTDPTSLARRGIEAGIIRTNSATLPADSRVLYVGDYNVSSSTETSYQAIVGNTIVPIGIRGIDPFNTNGTTGVDWTGNSLLSNKTYSCRSLHFRDDFQIMSSNVYYGVAGGLAYVSGTYHTFGNNGTIPYLGSTINNANNSLNGNLQPNPPISAAQCYTNLYGASDHLPVVADYTIPLGVAAPVANFSATPTNGTAPLFVNFTDASTGSITNRFWNFGDGNTTNLTATTVSHTYTASTYSVTLIVTGPDGAGTNTQSNYITATPSPALGVTPATAVSVVGEQGGPFSPGAQTYTLTNNGGGTLSWTAGISNNWLSLSATSGALGAGASTNVTVITNANIAVLVGGLYSNLVNFVNATNGTGNTNLVWTLLVSDGIADAWRLQYFGHVDPRADDLSRAEDDADGDGFSNLQEQAAGTDPKDSASALRITAIEILGDNVRISFTTSAGKSYLVERLDGFPGGWDTVTNGVGGTGGIVQVLDVGGAGRSNRFYRVLLLPPP